MGRFRGRVAVVTGAGSGIGRALAVALAAAGAVVVISDVDEAGLAGTVDLVRSTSPAVAAMLRSDRLDVTDREAVLRYAESVGLEFGRVELVINNAGVSHGGDVLGMSFTDIERVMAVDFWGVVNGTKAFLPYLIASGHGNLVNISSLFGLVAMPTQSAYVAAKYAVRGFTESLRMEMLIARHPVAVTCVHPGGVRTSIARNGTVNAGEEPSGRSDLFEEKLARTSAADAAAIILRGAARGRPRVLVGNDARLGHAVGSLSNRLWQRAVVTAFGRL
ncbi:NAD(P)-dependent dehydrogenase (short-subunit alcohol dehydrogenase family) [Nakamurella sp. UYEF19]|uniref:SDR family NAD(P)-dependent oxidoreductase n=1 Tax=Nakamurella sp. UYEF19 TaxID=1756392 RepID=UPI003393516A